MIRVLLVEDNEANRDMLTRRLQRRGFEVACAHDGAEGVRMAVRLRPDLVLMDMSLPVMDGWEATRQLKGNPATKAIPVLALTAHALPEERARCMAAGCSGFETKPVDLSRLLASMNELLENTRAEQTRELEERTESER